MRRNIFKKFYSVVLRLPHRIQNTYDHLLYFDYASRKIQIFGEIHKVAHDLLERYTGNMPMTPIMIQRILTVLAIIPFEKPCDMHKPLPNVILVSAAIMKVCAPQFYEAMQRNELKIEDLEAVFRLDPDSYDHELWKRVMLAATGRPATFPVCDRPIPPKLLQYTCEDFLEVFDARSLQIGQ